MTGALYTCQPHLVGFVNGMPLVVIELKKPYVPARTALERLNPALPSAGILRVHVRARDRAATADVINGLAHPARLWNGYSFHAD